MSVNIQTQQQQTECSHLYQLGLQFGHFIGV